MKSYRQLLFLTLLLAGTAFLSCGNSKHRPQEPAAGPEEKVRVTVPAFNADSAYTYIERQVAFGPRVPNSRAHRDCGDYLAAQLKRFGAEVYSQTAELTAYDGTLLHARNLIGVYRPEATKRILLGSRWDSRPYADQDKEQHRHTAIDGANDGASGVGVLLEIARQLQRQSATLGIDLVFFDAEDYGAPDFFDGLHRAEYWCLGSQYWGRIPHTANYKARFGILLDMVVGKNATFFYEGYSSRTAGKAMKKIWKAAERLGYSRYFIAQEGGEVTDDHVFVNRFRQIPCVDIIDYDPHSDTGFNPTWHTLDDNMEHIDKATLQAVGQTLLEVIYNEQ